MNNETEYQDQGVRHSYLVKLASEGEAEARTWLKAQATAYVLAGNRACSFFHPKEISSWISELIFVKATGVLAEMLALGWIPDTEQAHAAKKRPAVFEFLIENAPANSLPSIILAIDSEDQPKYRESLVRRLVPSEPTVNVPIWVSAHISDLKWVNYFTQEHPALLKDLVGENPDLLMLLTPDAVRRGQLQALPQYVAVILARDEPVGSEDPLLLALTDTYCRHESPLCRHLLENSVVLRNCDRALLRKAVWVENVVELKSALFPYSALPVIAQAGKEGYRWTDIPTPDLENILQSGIKKINEAQLKLLFSLEFPFKEKLSYFIKSREQSSDWFYLLRAKYAQSRLSAQRTLVKTLLLRGHAGAVARLRQEGQPIRLTTDALLTNIGTISLSSFELGLELLEKPDWMRMMRAAIDHRRDDLGSCLARKLKQADFTLACLALVRQMPQTLGQLASLLSPQEKVRLTAAARIQASQEVMKAIG